VPSGKRRVGANIHFAFWPAAELPTFSTCFLSGYIGQMMSVASPPPHDSYWTGRLGSCVRHHAAIASWLGP